MKIEEAIKVVELRRVWASGDEDTANIEKRTKAAEKSREEMEAFAMAIEDWTSSRGKYSLDDIRGRYGSTQFETAEEKKQIA